MSKPHPLVEAAMREYWGCSYPDDDAMRAAVLAMLRAMRVDPTVYFPPADEAHEWNRRLGEIIKEIEG